MGWVKVYEYDLGFYILDTLAQVNPNEKNYNEKHTMGAYKNAKENTSIETLTFERAIKHRQSSLVVSVGLKPLT
jgi:hypothetical protein